jgi:hypothetical protein
MKKLLVIPLLLVGCASFSTKQTDYSYEYDAAKGKSYPVRKIYTKATARTFFEGKSQLAQFKASQTDKTQSATVGTLSQETTATNLIPIVEAVAEGVVKGLGKTVIPVVP